MHSVIRWTLIGAPIRMLPCSNLPDALRMILRQGHEGKLEFPVPPAHVAPGAKLTNGKLKSLEVPLP